MDELLLALHKRGVRLHADGDRLCINAPKGALTEELRAAIALHKSRLLAVVHEQSGGESLDAPAAGAYDDLADVAHVESASGRTPPDRMAETLATTMDLSYAWDYADTRSKLRELYTKAKHAQWVSEDVLPWHLQPDPMQPIGPEDMNPLWGSRVWARMTPAERQQCNYEITSWTLSQFLHGEQGALLATAQLVDAVNDIDSKLYGATQVVDEARHVAVFNRYLQEKIGLVYPVNADLKKLLDLLLQDGRWDIKFLGMQILVEGLGLASLAMLRDSARDPLLRELAGYVMSDEARHMAYGVMSLRDYYRDQGEGFRNEREEFVYEGARLIRDRLLGKDVWEKLGLPVRECMEITLRAPSQVLFRQRLFSKIVPTVKRMGLLSERQRKRFAELGILQFENLADPFLS